MISKILEASTGNITLQDMILLEDHIFPAFVFDGGVLIFMMHDDVGAFEATNGSDEWEDALQQFSLGFNKVYHYAKLHRCRFILLDRDVKPDDNEYDFNTYNW